LESAFELIWDNFNVFRDFANAELNYIFFNWSEELLTEIWDFIAENATDPKVNALIKDFEVIQWANELLD